MGLLDSFLPSGGLLGLGGMSGNVPASGLMAGLYDPQQMQNYKLKQALLGAGIGLLSQQPSATPITFGTSLSKGLAGGLEAGQQAQSDYMNNVKDAYAMKRAGQQDQLTALQIQQEMLDAQHKAGFDSWVDTNPELTDGEKAIARADPTGFAQMYGASKYPGKPQWNQVGTDMYGRPQYGYPPAYDTSKAGQVQTGQAPPGQGPTAQDLTGITGEDYLQNLTTNKGQGYANQVRAIVEGRAPYPTGMLLKTPYGQQLATDVTQADPTFEAANASARAKLRQNATSGDLGKSTNAMSAALIHANQVIDNSLKLPNTWSPLANSAISAYTNATGGDAYSNFDTSMRKLADEFVTAYRMGGGNDSDIKGELSNVNHNSSHLQILGSLLNSAKLLRGKIESNQKQVDDGLGPASAKLNITNPQIDVIIQRLTDLHDKAMAGEPLTEGNAAATAPNQASSLTGKTSTGVGWSFQ